MFARSRIIAAALYWIFVVFVSVSLAYADPGWAEGGIPLLVVTLPWSIPIQAIGFSISFVPGMDKLLISEGSNFLMSVVICGGLNAALILGPSRVVRLLRNSSGARLIILSSVVILVRAAQAIMPSVEKDALERSRPHNVPKDAVHVGPAVGWWQYCVYDRAQDVDKCHTWNRGGLVLEEGEFVPYDDGVAATSGELRIGDINSGPDRVELQNGRILIPKAREADMKRFLDSLTGNATR